METRALNLSESERVLVMALVEDSSSRARRRARILLDAADGRESTSIARALNTRNRSVRLVLLRFDEKRLDIFSAAARKRVQSKGAALSPPEKHDLTAHSTMRQAARYVLRQQFSKLNKVEDAVRAAREVESVHDMRVACRRLNSAFRLFRRDLPAKRVKRLRGALEQLRDTLGEIRNLDVLGENLDAYCATAPDTDKPNLLELQTVWHNERTRIHADLVTLLDSAQIGTWKQRMGAFLDDDKPDHTPHVARALPALLWKQYGRVRAYETLMADASLEQLHALRIEIKRLRYTLEFFRGILAGSLPMAREAAEQEITDTLIKPLVTLQDQLGAIQDAVVAGRALTDFIAAQAEGAKQSATAAPDFRGVAAYAAFLQEHIGELRRGVPERWNVILDAPYRERLARATASI